MTTSVDEYPHGLPRIASVHGVLPEHRYEQSAITGALLEWGVLDDRQRALVRQFHSHAKVRTRHLALPLEEYAKLDGFGRANDAYLSAALDLAEQAAMGALATAGLDAAEIDQIVLVSTTGIATPSLDARLANRIGFRSDIKRLPLFGLGCVAGVAGLARLQDYLRPRPTGAAVLVAVELCSLTLQLSDSSYPAMIGSGLFGDGAAAVVMVGSQRLTAQVADHCPGPEILASRARLYPDTERLMGWDVSDSGFGIVLSSGIPAVIRRYLRDDVDGFLADHGLQRSDIGRWVCHPGGPKVLRAIEEQLELPAGATDVTWRSLASIGNISSASVLHVLCDTNEQRPEPGTLGLLMAVGPGFSSELLLVRW